MRLFRDCRSTICFLMKITKLIIPDSGLSFLKNRNSEFAEVVEVVLN
jgi:hypothetical protein